jgi:putative copper resistance protein D
MIATMEAALVALRFVQFAAAMVLFGAPVFALALGLRFPAGSAVRRDFDRWLRRCLVGAAIAALASAALWLDLEAGIMGNGWDRTLDPGTIALVLFDTMFGRAWCWHLGVALALLGMILLSPARVGVIALMGAALVASLAWAGHGVMHPGFGHVAIQAVHLLAGALWLGSLPALLHLLANVRLDRSPEWQDALSYMLPLYSRAGYVAVILVLATGILNSLLLVASMGDLATALYGRVLLVKIALVLLMVGIAAVNRFVLMPRRAAGSLRLSVAIEVGTGGLVLAAVSILGTLPPAMAS